ncbi:MAG: hypothetical protein MUE40_12025 [Anaerolineae bacterium]|jgi:hypothetical protein|nr:hypothetical protein [Anaerolineae bacterium]
MSDPIIRQESWTDHQLKAAGFHHYQRKKQVVMAREVSAAEAPLTVVTAQGDTLVASAGYMLCYLAGDVVHDRLEQYDHWPVEPQLFAQTYRAWDEPEWQPTPPEQHLMHLGCAPYYKAAGVWAKQVDEPVYIQSLEHEAPVKIDTGQILAIGSGGEPYSMGEQTFHDRYQLPPPPPPPEPRSPLRQVVQKLLRFLRSG